VDRIARGGEVLGPPFPQVELQWVDARDLCPWTVDLAERDQPGIYNACGPAQAVSWETLLADLARTLAPQPVKFTPATADVLRKTGIDLPLVGGADSLDSQSVHFSNAAAQAAGLRFHPLDDTARATLAWWRSLPAERRAAPEGWPTAAQESEALRLLREA
jgi:2'-hydroxyisoflavone reductase